MVFVTCFAATINSHVILFAIVHSLNQSLQAEFAAATFRLDDEKATGEICVGSQKTYHVTDAENLPG